MSTHARDGSQGRASRARYDFVAVPGQVEMTLPQGEQMILHSAELKSAEFLLRESAFAFSLGSGFSVANVIVQGGELDVLLQSLERKEVDVLASEADLQRRAKELEGFSGLLTQKI